MAGVSGSTAYRLAASLALAASLLQACMNIAVGIVGEPDNAQNQGFYGVVVTAAACAFVARLEAGGMARAMLATAATQALLGVMVATAPITAQDPNGAAGVLVLTGGFVSIWLLSAWFFQRAAGVRPRSAA